MKTIFLALCVSLSLLACKKKMQEEPSTGIVNMGSNTPPPVAAVVLRQGTFSSYDHGLAGVAKIIKDSTNNVILRLENFSMTEGPDVDLLLSKTSSYSSSNVIKVADLNGAYTNFALNVDIDDNIDLSVYKHIIVWCAKFSVSFGDTEPK
jgi:hypothetical protein